MTWSGGGPVVRCALGLFCLVALHSHAADPPETPHVPKYVHDTNLRKRLLTDYRKDVRPVVSSDQPMEIQFEITLVKMIDLDEIAHALSSSFILSKSWMDVRLRWNESDFGGLGQINIPSDLIWKPDISLFNIADQSYEHTYGEDAVVLSDGRVLWIPMVTARTWCPLNFLKFPFDTQLCYMKFGSWVYNANQLRLNFPGNKTVTEKDAYVYEEKASVTKEWKVTEFKQRRDLVKYHDTMPEWSEMTVTFKLRRLGRYYQSLFVAPIVLLAIVNPMVFLLPADATEKPILGSLTLLAVCILLINLETVIQPAHVTIPRLVMFYVSTLVLTSASVFASSVVCHLARKSHRLRGVPAWLAAIFLGRCGLRRILCVESYNPVSRFDALVTMGNEDDIGTEMDGPSQNPSHNELREIRKCLHAIAGRMNSENSIDSLSRDWYEIARVLDRLLLVIFYILLFLTAIAFLL